MKNDCYNGETGNYCIPHYLHIFYRIENVLLRERSYSMCYRNKLTEKEKKFLKTENTPYVYSIYKYGNSNYGVSEFNLFKDYCLSKEKITWSNLEFNAKFGNTIITNSRINKSIFDFLKEYSAVNFEIAKPLSFKEFAFNEKDQFFVNEKKEPSYQKGLPRVFHVFLAYAEIFYHYDLDQTLPTSFLAAEKDTKDDLLRHVTNFRKTEDRKKQINNLNGLFIEKGRIKTRVFKFVTYDEDTKCINYEFTNEYLKYLPEKHKKENAKNCVILDWLLRQSNGIPLIENYDQVKYYIQNM